MSGPLIVTAIHTLSPADVYQALHSDPRGLTQAEAQARLKRYGVNAIQEVKGKPLWIKFLANFTHLMAILLWVGGVVGFIAQMPQLAIAIWAVNLINGAFSFWQEFRAEKATQALRKLLPQYALVIRGGEEQRLLAEELVPGDVLILEEGERISADARLVEDEELRIDQSTLTGESHSVKKSHEPFANNHLVRAEISNLVFAGTDVAAGTGKAVVFATGMNTEFGKIAHLTQSVEEELSPLQKEMIHATEIVTVIAVLVGVAFFAIAITFAKISLAESFIFAMGMIVAFVPEGMLPTVTLALAMGVQRMAKRNALIKKLSAVETLGCTTVICTDKTGTLTENEMTVRELWIGGHRLTVTGVGYNPNGSILSDAAEVIPDDDLRSLLIAASLCNNARLVAPNGESQHWTILGDPTEAAMIVAATKAKVDIGAALKSSPRLRELPFESRRKRMSTIHQSGNDRVAYIKGAPKEVLALCTQIRFNGAVRSVDNELRAQIVAANDAYARDGLRVLAIASRALAASPSLSDHTIESVEHDLTFLGLIAMMDPPRPEVRAAVDKCHRAGIRVVMITGDYGLTAESIARRIGIVKQQAHIITSVELDAMSDDELKTTLRDEVIFARVAPEHKLRVVKILQAMGHIVAVTGDGVNDAPALKKADIGVAMGVSGTDVAKEAADMILTDDNFASIVNAIEEGRAVYANIKKFTTYVFTSNAPEAVPFIFFAFSAARIPLAINVMQVLSIDLGTDMVPALALGVEPPEEGIMGQPPRDLKQHVITRSVLVRAYLWVGMIESLAAMAAFYFMYWTNGYWGKWIDLPSSGTLYESATAMAVAAVVTTQIGNLFAQRTELTSIFHLNWFANRLIWIGIACELTLVCLIIYVPFFQWVFGTSSFPIQNWLFLFAWTPVLVLADEAVKWMMRRKRRSSA